LSRDHEKHGRGFGRKRDWSPLSVINPQDLSHLWVLAAAGLVGFVGNELAAQVRLRAGRRLSSPALIADGNHARVDGSDGLDD
jgi:divalent metal cation (Fe/Co/Zn/Cd) transporter